MAGDKVSNDVIRDATLNIPKAAGGSRSDTAPVTTDAPIWYPLKPRKEHGKTVIYVSFDTPKPRHDHNEQIEVNDTDPKTGAWVTGKFPKAANPRNFSEPEKAMAREAMRNIENVADVVFVEVGWTADGKPKNTDYPKAADVKPEQADLSFFTADKAYGWGKGSLGYAANMDKKDGPRDIVMTPHEQFRQTFYHELSHAVAAINHFSLPFKIVTVMDITYLPNFPPASERDDLVLS